MIRSQHPSELGTLDARVVGAFLGAAIGDALGWPYEDRARRAGNRSRDRTYYLAFEDWVKRSGGRFMPHEERIGAGEYSDDTQLILGLSRSLLSSHEWWEDFAFVELPFWASYERGGGGATKRAVDILLTGKTPWQAKLAEAEKYFQAGGNGVAMRVLPSVVSCLFDPEFRCTAWSVMAHGVATHGHPRALVGALAFAFALRTAFRQTSTLGYGQLIDETLAGVQEWAPLIDIGAAWEGWSIAAHQHSRGEYGALWHSAVHEMIALLEIAREGVAKGALAIDRDILERLGCFDRRQNGAGTVAAAAAIFLASRYAPSPANGVICAATASGADTDTIASMVGSVLGAINGQEWMLPTSRHLQDERYIHATAIRLLQGDRIDGNRRPVRRKDLDRLAEMLAGHPVGEMALPDGRVAVLIGQGPVVSKSAGLGVGSWSVHAHDGQTLFIKKLFRTKTPEPALPLVGEHNTAAEFGRISIQLLTNDVNRSRHFYSEILGMTPIKETSRAVNYGSLTLRAAEIGVDVDAAQTGNITVFIETRNLEAVRQRLERYFAGGVETFMSPNGVRTISVQDPDGYRIDFVQK